MQESSLPLFTLLRRAGIESPVTSIEPIKEGITNYVSLVKLQNGFRFILREYRWPHSAGDDLKRLQKEVFLHNLFQTYDVRAPRIIATAEDNGVEAILMEFVLGDALGDVLRNVPEDEQRHAWQVCGEALRKAHSIHFPESTAGVIVGNMVRSFSEGSWGHFHLKNTLHHARKILEKRPDIQIDLESLESILTMAVPVLNNITPVLLHNDPHPWNVLVRKVEGKWICTAWLDWEYAWVGDPTWDLVRMEIFRVKSVGSTPPEFYEGYGAFPSEPHRSVYELAIYLWMYNQYLDGDRTLMPTYEAAMKYMAQVDLSIQKLYQRFATTFGDAG